MAARTAPNFNSERAAMILADASVMGDAAAAAKWDVSDKTVRNYRARASNNPDFAALYRKKQLSISSAWSEDAGRFLGKALAKLEKLVEQADDPKYIHDVAGAIKVVGELRIAKEVLSEPESDPAGSEPPADQSASPARLKN